MMKSILPGLLTCLLLSCALFEKSKIEEVYFNEALYPKDTHFNIVLKDIDVQKDLDSATIRGNAEEIFTLLIKKYNQKKGASATEAYTSVVLKETSYISDYENLNTVALEIKIFGENDNDPVRILLFSEETKNTLSSYRYLYSIVERSFRRIFP
ncbi:hypothetical protein ES703_66692 [subsurface metagenome]